MPLDILERPGVAVGEKNKKKSSSGKKGKKEQKEQEEQKEQKEKQAADTVDVNVILMEDGMHAAAGPGDGTTYIFSRRRRKLKLNY